MAPATASLVLVVALAAACEKEPAGTASAAPATAGEVVAGWSQAGLEPAADFVATDGAKLGGGTCQVGVISGVEVLLCEYADAETAARAHPTGLAHIGKQTGSALISGPLMLVVTDRSKADPQGHTIDKLTREFRGTSLR